MLTLALLRHAKSSWDADGTPDFDRDLAPRGLEAAPRMGAEMASSGFSPDLVLCSSALRARRTLDLALPFVTPPPRAILHEDRLYMASAAQLLQRVRELPGDVRSVLMVGHNPGFHEFSIALIGEFAPGTESAAKSKFPTCALAVYTFGADNWTDIGPRKGRVVHFVTPRALSGE